jgi:hypothetical protein
LKAPVSQRIISKREEIILLEGSKLHGFIFPQWTSDPDDSIFAGDASGQSAFMYVLSPGCIQVSLLTVPEILLICSSRMLRERFSRAGAGLPRPRLDYQSPLIAGMVAMSLG